MSKHKKRLRPSPAAPSGPVQPSIPRASKEDHVRTFPTGTLLAGLVIVAAVAAGVWFKTRQPASTAMATAAPANTAVSAASTNLPAIEVAQALMVTVELDFGSQLPTIAEALRDIERRSEPEDGVGRTFAILDAYGQPTPEGKLHLSMHLSTEKPGKGALVFKRTGAVLWESRIVPATNQVSNFAGKNLLILVDNGEGKLWTVDGSSNPATVLDANIKETGIPLRDLWFDQTEREVTFMYSACGCPVKVQTRRDGDRTVRVKDQPVIFPDDPAVVGVIEKVMGWQL